MASLAYSTRAGAASGHSADPMDPDIGFIPWPRRGVYCRSMDLGIVWSPPGQSAFDATCGGSWTRSRSWLHSIACCCRASLPLIPGRRIFRADLQTSFLS